MEARLRVTLVHDWLTGMRGGEKVLDAFARIWPDAKLFTLLHDRGSVSAAIERLTIRQSWLGGLPWARHWFRWALPLFPQAVEGLRLPPCDLVLSSSHCVAKGVRAPRGTPHVCYCFTPMRYVWQMRQAYFPRTNTLPGRLFHALLDRLQAWDRRSAARVTHFVAISETVRRRIHESYGRQSAVIHPPVDTDFFTPDGARRQEYYLVVSALAPYKRVDLAIEACNRLGRRLVVVGAGPEAKKLRALAGPTVHFTGWQSDETIRHHFRRCRALLFPGEEDFGIVPVEANACGTPVVCFGRGGATETIVPLGARQRPTGVWFAEQNADCLAAAMLALERQADIFDPASCRRQAMRFNRQRFEQKMREYVAGVLSRGLRQTSRAA